MTFSRLSFGHVLAFVAALALLLAMAPDWYTDKVAEQDRDIEEKIIPRLDRETTPRQSKLHAEAAEKHEKNAWQAPAAIDRLILLLLLATAGLAIAAAFLRAADRDLGPPSPSALATLTGLLACAAIAYRIFQPPGLNEAAVVKWGAPLGLVCAGLVALGSRMASRAERERPRADAGASGDAGAGGGSGPGPADAPPSPAGAA